MYIVCFLYINYLSTPEDGYNDLCVPRYNAEIVILLFHQYYKEL